MRGIHFRLPLTIENRGDVNSVVRRFDLYVEETEMNYTDLKLSPGNTIQTAETLYMGLDTTWLAGPRELRCTLTITDTNGITARADLTAKNADAR